MWNTVIDRELEHFGVYQNQSQIFGSRLVKKLTSMQLTPTDLPEPVVPATKRGAFCQICDHWRAGDIVP